MIRLCLRRKEWTGTGDIPQNRIPKIVDCPSNRVLCLRAPTSMLCLLLVCMFCMLSGPESMFCMLCLLLVCMFCMLCLLLVCMFCMLFGQESMLCLLLVCMFCMLFGQESMLCLLLVCMFCMLFSKPTRRQPPSHYLTIPQKRNRSGQNPLRGTTGLLRKAPQNPRRA